jgi:aldose 1-epimerase
MNISQKTFGLTPKGEQADLFVLKNDQMEVSITNYGGIITSIRMPDKRGIQDEIVLGFNRLEEYWSEQYLRNCHYFGCIIGRVCNRISNGRFDLNGKSYQLAINDADRHLHGGIEGFDKKLWTARLIEGTESIGVRLSYLSPHMDEGYPGELLTKVRYTLNKKNELSLDYKAETNQATIINLTNHTYFNLNGGKANILNHSLEIPAEKYVELKNLMPTGKIVKVKGTPFDFREKRQIGKSVQLLPNGYDLNYVLKNPRGKLVWAGTLSEETSGRSVQVFTTQPGLQIYSGYYIPELELGGKKQFGKYSGFALETQHYADSINQPEFPSTVLNPEEKYHQKTVYKFVTE